MCGIVGYVASGGVADQARAALGPMTDRLAPRGPDGRGLWYSDDASVGFGHRRLAILDMSDAGAQPMIHDPTGLVLTFNGEIYNHWDLRRELEASGASFRSTCDAETLLAAFAEWGPACVPRLRGIFAFAIWDPRKNRLFAARDHLGVKPFSYVNGEDAFLFSSQPKSFLDWPGFDPRISDEGVSDYLSYGIIPADKGLLTGVEKLEPGRMLFLQDGKVRIERYWTPPEAEDSWTFEGACEAVSETLRSVVGRQLLSDVPVTTFLSGGIDSSLISAMAAEQYDDKVRSYTIGFDVERSDERPYAELTAKRCGLDQFVGVLTPDDAETCIEDAVAAYDEPFGIGAALPMVAISRLAAGDGAKVVLTGDGADEIFAGYRHYDGLAEHYRKAGRSTADTPASGLLQAIRFRAKSRFDPLTAYSCHNAEIGQQATQSFFGERICNRSNARWREEALFRRDLAPVEAARRCDLETYLPDEILVKVDRATMNFGIEARVPFLDPELVDLGLRIPAEIHHRGGERKAILKKVASDWLPDEVLTARKKGFSAPLAHWFVRGGNRRAAMTDRILEGVLVKEGFLNRATLEGAIMGLKRPAAGLVQLYLFERWAETWTRA